jgi:alanyl-tRNA synthetase
MQYKKMEDGSFEELTQKNVDFGGGFERLLAAQNQDNDVFTTEIFAPIMKTLEKLSGLKYSGSDEETKRSFRVIADHARAAVMLAADGVFPSNKAQGYFSRRMVRRAIRYGKMIGITELFFHTLVADVADIYKNAYPDVSQKSQDLTARFHDEEKRFNATLEKGLKEFEHAVSGKVTNIPELTAEIAFRLYETFGFPLELSLEEAQNRGIALEDDISTKFDKLRQSHAEASRSASAGMFKGGLADHSEVTTKYHTATHLLQAALRQILGTHVQQKGSNITGERLRFDFTHTGPMTDEEKSKVEALVNEWVKQDLPVTKQTLPKQKALESGAIAFFIEKYPDEVTVYTVGNNPDGTQGEDWISKEFCGGPHVTRTGEIGQLKLTKEQAVSAGVRRVYMELA